ncbi:MAG TPA: peptidoglycan DD-metalloendopeptidase family protein [Acidimicrobiales bacterium]
MKYRRHARALVTATALLVVLPGLVPGGGGWGALASAQTEADKSRIDDQIESLQEQVTEASAEEARLLGLLDESSGRLADLDGKVADFDGQIAQVQGNLDAAQSRLAALEAEQHRTETRLGEASVQLAAAKEALSQQAIAAYTGQSEAARYAGMLLGSGSLDELVHRRSYLKAVVGSQAEVIADNERLRDEVKDLKDQLERSRAEAIVQRDVVTSQRDRLQVARDAQNVVREDAAAEVAQQEALKAEVIARKAEYQAEVEQLEAESAAIAETLRQRAAARAAGNTDIAALPAGSGQLLFPVPGGPITSSFGYRIHPIYGDARLHTGIDIGADTGDPIYASADGVVASTGSLGGYGNATVIEHGGGLATLYGHQSSILVSEGETVTQGEVIGRVGCTGACTGPHLHFEVRVDGEPVDPMGYL